MGSPPSPHSVLLVEDDPVTRARIARVIEGHPKLRLAGAVGSVAAARAALERETPAVLLTDIDLPDGTGVALIAWLRARGAVTAPMVVSVFGDETHVVEAIEAGALGYLLKDGDADYIATSILEMLDGGSPISPPIARYLLRRLQAPSPDAGASAAPAPRLSPREQEVLNLIAKGFSYAEIAGLLGLTAPTVATHTRGIYRKLDVHSRGEAVYEALQLGLVKP
jgi:DNA-binding NarL/FixJ family response regulator